MARTNSLAWEHRLRGSDVIHLACAPTSREGRNRGQYWRPTRGGYGLLPDGWDRLPGQGPVGVAAGCRLRVT
jgi:hypothetical protein